MRSPTVDERRAVLFQEVEALDDIIADVEAVLNELPWNNRHYTLHSDRLHELQLQRAKLIVKIDRIGRSR